MCLLSYMFFLFLFFFSSRRRHTRCSRDWSSDVCSSDLFQAGFAEVLRLLLRKEICRRKQDYRPNKPQPGFSCPQRLRRNGGMDEPYHAGHKLLWCARSLKPWTRPHMFFRPDSGSALEESEIRVSVQAGKSDLLRKWKAGFST